MNKLYLVCGGCRYFMRADGACRKMFEGFPIGRIPDPVARELKKGEMPQCWEESV